ncbi:hypothetical protein D3C79_903070 [compost metagenome]
MQPPRLTNPGIPHRFHKPATRRAFLWAEKDGEASALPWPISIQTGLANRRQQAGHLVRLRELLGLKTESRLQNKSFIAQ